MMVFLSLITKWNFSRIDSLKLTGENILLKVSTCAQFKILRRIQDLSATTSFDVKVK